MSGAREQVSRLLALVPYLQTRTDVSLAQVAADFGVRPEQIMKDLKVLWMCGLPGLTPDKMIDVDFGAIEDDPEGVVRIDNADFLSRPVRLGSSEASALIVALRALREGSPESSHEVIDRCLIKLEDATATGTATPPVAVHLPQSPAAQRHAATLQKAIRGNRQARLDYYVPTRDETTQRTVDPLELLTGEGHDYLDAWCHLAQARRLFRLDRMHAVEIVDEPRQEHDLTPRDLSEGLFEAGSRRRRGDPAPRALRPLGGGLLPGRLGRGARRGTSRGPPEGGRSPLAGPARAQGGTRGHHRGTDRAAGGARTHGAGHAGAVRRSRLTCRCGDRPRTPNPRLPLRSTA